MKRNHLRDACNLALAWLTSKLLTRDWVRELRPAEKDIGDAAIVLEVVSRIPLFQTTATGLLSQLWQQPNTRLVLDNAMRGDSDSRLRSLVAYASFLRSGVIGTFRKGAVLEALIGFSPRSTLESIALYYCHESIPHLPTPASTPTIDPWALAETLMPFPIIPSIEIAYSITHTFLYASNFGYSTESLPESYSVHTTSRMPRWMQHFMDLPDNDVVAELSMIASILAMPSGLYWAEHLASRQSSSGALFASDHDDEGFHTTLVGLLAWSAALRLSNSDSLILTTTINNGRCSAHGDTTR